MSSRSNSKKRSRTRSKSPKTTKKRKVSKSKDSASSSDDDTTKRARPANQIIKSKINEGKQSQVVSIYGFGNNSLGQLGFNPDKTDKVSEATLIDRLDDINCLDVVTGKDVNIIVESNNTAKYRKVIIFGTMETTKNKEEKKEVKSNSDNLGWEPSSMDIFDKQFIVQASAGESHCAVLTDEGDVYTWGMYNNEKGEKAGFKINRPSNETQDDPEKIKFDMFQDIVVQIASTPNRTLVLTQVGEVYEWGFTKMQNKVSARHANRSLLPQRVIVPEKVYALYCCAGEQIFALGPDDTVYAWGNNANYQLGIDKYQPPPPPEDEKSKEKKKATKKDAPKDKPKETEKKTKGKKSTEKSSEGKKGDDEKEKKPTVPRIKKKKDNHIRPVAATLINDLKLKIVKICGGLTHTVVLAKNGDVYIWGKNNYGQLGLGKKLDEEVAEPTKLGIDDVVDISCGAFHTVIVTKGGDVYAFGLAKDGRIPSDNDHESEPLKIDTKRLKHKIVQVHCGKRHTLLVGVKD